MSQYERKDDRPRRAPLDPNNPTERRDKDNVIRVSTNRNTRFWIYLAKIYLKRYKEVELHGFGDAITSCVRVSENLDRFEYANFSKIQFVTQVVNGRRGSNQEGRALKRVKMIIKMKQSSNFEELTQNLKID